MLKSFKRFNFISAAFLILFVLCSEAGANIKIGIIGAMDVEIDFIKQSAKINNTVTKAGINFFEGTLGSHDIVIARCGMGKVNSGICAQILIDSFKVTHVINTGTAGAVGVNAPKIGSVIIGSGAVQYDFDATPIGFRLAEIPYTDCAEFPCDEDMREKFLASAEKIVSPEKIIISKMFTADQFLTDPEQINRLQKLFNGSVCDMESGAIAQVCYLNNIPCAVIRCISDGEGDHKKEDFHAVEKTVSNVCASIVVDMIKNF